MAERHGLRVILFFLLFVWTHHQFTTSPPVLIHTPLQECGALCTQPPLESVRETPFRWHVPTDRFIIINKAAPRASAQSFLSGTILSVWTPAFRTDRTPPPCTSVSLCAEKDRETPPNTVLNDSAAGGSEAAGRTLQVLQVDGHNRKTRLYRSIHIKLQHAHARISSRDLPVSGTLAPADLWGRDARHTGRDDERRGRPRTLAPRTLAHLSRWGLRRFCTRCLAICCRCELLRGGGASSSLSLVRKRLSAFAVGEADAQQRKSRASHTESHIKQAVAHPAAFELCALRARGKL
eukprot:1558806-Prymnesium_polylepis.1